MKKINPFVYAFFLLFVTGMIFNFSGCQTAATTNDTKTTKGSDPQSNSNSTGTKASIEIKPNTDQPSAKKSAYKDGSFEGKGSYAIPQTPNEDGDNDKEDVTVRVVIKNGVVDSVDLQSPKANPISKKWQQTFLEGAQKQMVGKPLEQMGTFTKVNGSSLTGTGFQEALDQIKKEAQA